MTTFEQYLQDLADHEEEKSRPLLADPRVKIRVYGGMRLNWLGDFFGNPNIKWQEQELLVDIILFGGTGLAWDRILIDQCKRSPAKFRELIGRTQGLRAKFESEVSSGEQPIVVRHSPDREGYYHVLDGMHRFVGAVIGEQTTIKAYVPVNEHEHLPRCESHVVYDLIRGFMRHAADEQGKEGLYQALKLLMRTYENVGDLLRHRFNAQYVRNQDVQDVIQRVLNEK